MRLVQTSGWAFAIALAITLSRHTDAFARVKIVDVRPESLERVTFPAELICLDAGHMLGFEVWAGEPMNDPKYLGTVTVSDSAGTIVYVAVDPEPYRNGQVWRFSVAKRIVDHATFSVERPVMSGYACVFHLGPLLEHSFRETRDRPSILRMPYTVEGEEQPEQAAAPYKILTLGPEPK